MNTKLKYLVVAMATVFSVNTVAEETTEKDKKEIEVIEVTGMRASMASSTLIKKETMEIVDSITAEDIGKLADPNVAETLSRIPGVQVYRYGGEAASPVGQGSGLTIRGLSGQTSSHIDGRAYFTAGSSEFNIESAIPGMISGIDVYKNPSAEHIEGGIGGLVDIRTRKPLDFDKETFSAAVSTRYNQLSEESSPEIFGLYSNQFELDRGGVLGFMIAGSYQKSFNRSDSNPGNRGENVRRAVRADAVGYEDAGGDMDYAGRSDIWYLADVSCADGSSYIADVSCLPESERQDLLTTITKNKSVYQEDIKRKRQGYNGAIQWKPNDDFELTLSGIYNSYLYDQDYRFLILNDSRTIQNLETADFTFDEDFVNRNLYGGDNDLVAGEMFSSGTALDSTFRTLGGHEEQEYTTWQVALNGEWLVNESILVGFDFSTIQAEKSKINRVVDMRSAEGVTINVTRDLLSEPHGLAISGADLTDPNNYRFHEYTTNADDINEDDGIAAKVDFTYFLDSEFITSVKVGARYATHNAVYKDYRNTSTPSPWVPLGADGDWPSDDGSNHISAADHSDLLETSPTNWLDGEAGYSGGYLVYSPDKLFDDTAYNAFSASNLTKQGEFSENILNRRISEEATTAGYVQADFEYNDFIQGNVGVRVVHTDLWIEAQITNQEGIVVPNSDSTSYVDVLPSLNVAVSLDEEGDTLLRFGYAKAITRPTLGDLNPTLSADPSTGYASAGNPDLKPLEANSFDISLENYFTDTNYIAMAIFYKDIDGFFNSIGSCETLAAYPTHDAPESSPNGCLENEYKVTRTVNAEEGYAKGVEFAVQSFLDYDYIPTELHNFGFAASYTYIKTSNPVEMNNVIVETDMPFQSEDNYSFSGIYEDDFMSARIIYTYRSDFILFGVDQWPTWARYIKGYGILDASVNFELSDNFSMSVNASNLTDQGPNRYLGEPGDLASSLQHQYFSNGRVFGLSLRYTM
ncbi:MAG: TonB-dependent receptor [Colwellia sp.]